MSTFSLPFPFFPQVLSFHCFSMLFSDSIQLASGSSGLRVPVPTMRRPSSRGRSVVHVHHPPFSSSRPSHDFSFGPADFKADHPGCSAACDKVKLLLPAHHCAHEVPGKYRVAPACPFLFSFFPHLSCFMPSLHSLSLSPRSRVLFLRVSPSSVLPPPCIAPCHLRSALSCHHHHHHRLSTSCGWLINASCFSFSYERWLPRCQVVRQQ